MSEAPPETASNSSEHLAADGLEAGEALTAELDLETKAQGPQTTERSDTEAGTPTEEQRVAAARSDVEVAAESKTGQTIAERHPNWPPVELRFHFWAHKNADDAAELKDELKDDVDIYFFEGVGEEDGKNTTRRKLQEAADTPRDVKRHKLRFVEPFWDATAESLHGTGKIVDSFDLVEGDSISGDEMLRELGRRPWRGNSDLETTLDVYAAHQKQGAEKQAEREVIMADRYETKLEEIIKSHPELLKKDKIVGMSALGAFHTGLFRDLDERGENVSNTFSPKFKQFSHEEELSMSYRFGREPSRELVARAYMEDALNNLLMEYEIANGGRSMLSYQPDRNPVDDNDYGVYKRALTDRLEMNDIAELHPKIAKLRKFPNPFTRRRLLKAIVAKAGMGPLPKSAGELHQIAERYRPQVEQDVEQSDLDLAD